MQDDNGVKEYIIQQTGTENAQTYQVKHSRSYSLDLTPDIVTNIQGNV